jgi:DNA-binding HxlR family transcriptional regulator
MTKRHEQLCPIARTLDLVGDRWTLLIIRDLFFGCTRFTEFREHSPGIPTKTLSERLKTLEAHAIVERRIYSQHPLRASYHLTAEGRSLEPILSAVYAWGSRHRLTAPERRAVVHRVRGRVAEGRHHFVDPPGVTPIGRK